MNMPLTKTIRINVEVDCDDFFQTIKEGNLDPFSLVGIARRAIEALTPDDFARLTEFFGGTDRKLAVLQVLRDAQQRLAAIEAIP